MQQCIGFAPFWSSDAYDVDDPAAIDTLLKEYRDFVALCAQKEFETGKPCLIIASY